MKLYIEGFETKRKYFKEMIQKYRKKDITITNFKKLEIVILI